MNEKILAALIAGSVSFVVSLIGFLSSWVALQAKKREIEQAIKNSYMERLYEIRLKNYPKALEMTKYLTLLPKNGESFDREFVIEIRNKLGDWMNNEGGLVASSDLIKASYDLRNRLSAGYAENGRYSKEQMEKIISSITNFRKELRSDIKFLHKSDKSRIREIG